MSNSHSFLATLLVSAALFLPATLHAQDIAGKWTAEYPRSVRNVNGVASGDDKGTAILVIEVKGDSIFGTWHAQNPPNPSTPRAFRGTYSNGKVVFTGEPVTATIRRAGGGGEGDSSLQMVTYYEGILKDGVIEGTFRGESTDQTVTTPSMKWTAKRQSDK
jgi:hypothetical protein